MKNQKTIMPVIRPVNEIQDCLSSAIQSIFSDATVQCSRHVSNNEEVLVMTANGICATLHIQELGCGV